MKIFTSLFITFSFAIQTLTGQVFLSKTYLETRTKDELNAQFGLPIFRNGVHLYKITYLTPNVQGQPSVASGLIAVPDDPAKVYPMLSYSHGTSVSREEVPSRLNQEGDLVAALGGVGFLTVAPDYLGLGDSPGFHPYVHAETEATASVDMLRAAREFAEEKSIYLNDQVFVAGYSQGGHAAMALHRKLELELSDEFTVTAAAPMSGPYSIGEVMQQLIFTDTPQEYFFPAYVPYTVLSFQYAGQTVYNELTDLFKPEYAVNMEKFFNEDLDLQQLNFLLVSTLTLNTGASIPVRMFQDNIIHDIKTDPNHPFNLALKANNVYDWSPKAPTRLFYCEADDQVPAQNSLVAEAVMLGNGAADLDALDVQSDADHVECVLPAALATVSFFSQFQVVGDTLADAGQRVFENLKAYPNPAAATVYFENLPPGSQVRLLDLQGNFVFSTNPSSTADMLSLPVLPASLYVLEVESEGYVWRQKWFVKQ